MANKGKIEVRREMMQGVWCRRWDLEGLDDGLDVGTVL